MTSLADHPDLTLTVSEAGHGRPVLLLHGGGGPATVSALGHHLARRAHTLTPTHPGWDGADRPSWLTGIDDLAMAYLHLLHDRGLRDVLVVGSSLGGWIAAEMAVRDTAGLVSGLVLVDAVGIDVPGEPIQDFFTLDPPTLGAYTWHDPERFRVDPSTVTPQQQARQAANRETMRVLVGDPYMHDPKLRRRLARVRVPALLLWGASDRIVTPAYGAAYAAAFGDGRLVVVPEAGHLPHVENPTATLPHLDAWLDRRRESGA
ncbi:alpha/beta fold hydrolase [Micromonospora sp. NPDC051300]|uniref:alpha/beta fold hydrolase n=1 Tax=Micromonospora sp. NPDC051300 TaxID=3364286 RepID=UPI0037A3002E